MGRFSNVLLASDFDHTLTDMSGQIPARNLEAIAAFQAEGGIFTVASGRSIPMFRKKAALVPVNAPYFDGASLLIAADCTAYAYANFHEDFIKGRIVLVGCPKLDAADYSEKLEEIIRNNNIASVTIVRMEVPCCGGLEMAAKKALQNSGKFIPWQVTTISVDGKLLD